MRFIEAQTIQYQGFWGSIGDLIWWFLWAFIFVTYLFALFAVIGDLFRDHKLSGWWKAIWIIFLIFVPFLTLLVYLIARGNGMAERGAAQAKELRTAQDQYIKSVAGCQPLRGDRQGQGAARLGRHHAGGVRAHQDQGPRRLSTLDAERPLLPAGRRGRVRAPGKPQG